MYWIEGHKNSFILFYLVILLKIKKLFRLSQVGINWVLCSFLLSAGASFLSKKQLKHDVKMGKSCIIEKLYHHPEGGTPWKRGQTEYVR
jgi:hypothetical protein